MLKRSTALAAAAALTTFQVIAPVSLALSSENDSNNLRGRPVGDILIDNEERMHDDISAPSSTFGRFLESIWNTSDEDIDEHYPLFLTNNKPAKDDFHVDDILFSFTLSAPNSSIMRQPPRRKLAEAAHEDEEGHEDSNGNDMVVHVTYEHIYAILVFLITATALGIVTSKLGMVSNDMLTSIMHLDIYDASLVLFLHTYVTTYSIPCALSIHIYKCCILMIYACYFTIFSAIARSCRRNHHWILARTASS